MSREEKIKIAIEKGFTYDTLTGDIYSRFGRKISRKDKNGYILLQIPDDNKKQHHLLGHHFVFYYIHKEIVDYIDHIDGNRSNNKIDNLRSVTHQKNMFNQKSKGFICRNGRYEAHIGINYKQKYLGTFNTEQEARQAYLDAKKIHHII